MTARSAPPTASGAKPPSRRRGLWDWFARIPLIQLALIGITAVSTNWLATATQEMIEPPHSLRHEIFYALFYAVVFAVCSIWLYTTRARLFGARNLRQIPVQPTPVLLMFLSTQSPGGFSAASTWPLHLPPENPANSDVILSGADLAGDVAGMRAKNPKWNWAPILRAIAAHRTALERIYLIGSADIQGKAGSWMEFALCETIIKHYRPHVEVLFPRKGEPGCDGIDFENFEQIHRYVARIVHSEERRGIKHRQITIDITGGQKPTSIAGAAATLNLQTVCQYVQTSRPYDVFSYDLHYEFDASV
jgi:hypothetical protein